jgi:hypothetical protein
VIQEVDQAIEAVIRQEALQGTSVEVAFEAPTKDWAARRNAPTLDAYLYDIREDQTRRSVGFTEIRDDEGKLIGRGQPVRHYKLSYLVTAWTQRPEDEHRLLSAILSGFLRWNSLPPYALNGSLADQPLQIPVTIGLPPPHDRAISDIWSALGGELKPSLDLVVTAPIDTRQVEDTAVPVQEPLRFTVHRTTDGVFEEAGGLRRRPAEAASGAEKQKEAAMAAKAASGRVAARPRRRS